MSSVDHIGRVGVLCNLVSKPELNGAFVVLESYSEDKDRYAVKTLRAPNSDISEISILVKLANIQFPRAETFASKFPNPVTQPGAPFFRQNLNTAGTILDFTIPEDEECRGESGMHAFCDSCRVLGRPGEKPTTKFLGNVMISLDDSGKVIEILNIDFASGTPCCTKGDNITFRNCRFAGEIGLGVGVRKVGTVDVLVESCVFHGNSDGGVVLSSPARVTLVNCTFRDCHPGVQMVEGCRATLVNCDFVHCKQGICMAPKGQQLEVVNCSFTSGETGVVVQDGGSACVRGCRIQSCTGYGVMVSGPRRTNALIDDCVISDCGVGGIAASTGKVDLTLTNTTVTKCLFGGVMLLMNLLGGAVRISNCQIKGNVATDLVNHCGVHCTVTIDNVVQKPSTRAAELAESQPIRQQMLKDTFHKVQNKYNVPLKDLRVHKAVGLSSVTCSNCCAVEPTEVKFKACGKCANVVYCCKECQVAHWKEHKKACRKK